MSKKQINRFNEKSLKGNLLINIRDNYIKTLAKTMLDQKYNIIPVEYIDEKLRLESIKHKIEPNINYSTRLEFLTNLFLKECTKGTSQIISNLCK